MKDRLIVPSRDFSHAVFRALGLENKSRGDLDPSGNTSENGRCSKTSKGDKKIVKVALNKKSMKVLCGFVSFL